MSLPTRKIGNTEVTAIGFGCMGLSSQYGSVPSDEERLKFLDEVFESGCRNWDTSDLYGDSEELLSKWFKRTGKRSEVFLATKFGFRVGASGGLSLCGTPEYTREALEKSLKRLQTDYIDLWYLHRPDPTVPVELTIRAMAEAVKSGKVKYLGISECTASTLRRAHATYPLAALQMEYSPFELEMEEARVGVLDVARELGIAFVAYSPLGRGMLTGRYQGPDDFEEGDLRRVLPKYSKENFPNVIKLVDTLKNVGTRHGNATPGQVALAWLLAQSKPGMDIIPIPGTKKAKYLLENLGALKITLSEAELLEVRAAAEQAGASKLPRVPDFYAHLNLVDTPPLQK